MKSAGYLSGADLVADYAILSFVGVGWAFYAIGLPLMLGEAGAAFLLFRRDGRAFRLASLVILVEVVSSAFVVAISLMHREEARTFYVASREAQGLSARPAAIDFIFSVQGLLFSIVAYAAFYALVYYFLRKVRAELTVGTA